MYTLVAVLSLVATAAFVRRRPVILVVALTLLLYTHTWGVFLLAGFAVVALRRGGLGPLAPRSPRCTCRGCRASSPRPSHTGAPWSVPPSVLYLVPAAAAVAWRPRDELVLAGAAGLTLAWLASQLEPALVAPVPVRALRPRAARPRAPARARGRPVARRHGARRPGGRQEQRAGRRGQRRAERAARRSGGGHPARAGARPPPLPAGRRRVPDPARPPRRPVADRLARRPPAAPPRPRRTRPAARARARSPRRARHARLPPAALALGPCRPVAGPASGEPSCAPGCGRSAPPRGPTRRGSAARSAPSSSRSYADGGERGPPQRRRALHRRQPRGPAQRGRPISERARMSRRTLENYLRAGMRPRWMERLIEIERGTTREQRERLGEAYAALREECGPDRAALRPPLARDRGGVALRGAQRAHPHPQRVVPGRARPADGPAHARLRARQRPLVPAPRDRRRLDPRAVPGQPTCASGPIAAAMTRSMPTARATRAGDLLPPSRRRRRRSVLVPEGCGVSRIESDDEVGRGGRDGTGAAPVPRDRGNHRSLESPRDGSRAARGSGRRASAYACVEMRPRPCAR